MNLEIFKELKCLQKECIQELNQKNQEKEFLEKFILKNQLNTILNIMKINLRDFMIAYLDVQKKNLTFSEISEIVKSNHILFEQMDPNEFREIMNSVFDIVEEKTQDQVKEIIAETSKYKRNWLIKKMSSKSKLTKEDLESLISLHDSKTINIIDLFLIAEEDMETLKEAGAVVLGIKTMFELREITKDKMQEVTKEMHIRFSSKEYEKVFNRLVKTGYRMDFLTEVLDKIKDYASSLIEQENKTKKIARRNLTNYIVMEEWLQKQKAEERIHSLPANLSKIPDEKLRKEILKVIYQHNEKFHQELKEEYEQLSRNSENCFRALFQEYHISIDEYDIDMTKGIDDTRFILEKFKELSITEPEEIIEILNHTTKEITENIFQCVNKGYVTKQLVKEAKQIWMQEKEDYTNFMKNIKLMQEKNISPTVIMKTSEILLEENHKLENNLKILEEYQFSKVLRNASSLIFLKQENLREKIDQALELGLETFLEEDFELIDSIGPNAKKILIINRLNIPIENKEDLTNIIASKKFIIPDEYLDYYIYNATNYNQELEEKEQNKEELLEFLEQFLKTKNTYEMNGIRISKNKVKRNLSQLGEVLTTQQIMDALTYSMSLTQEEYETLANFIMKIKTQNK